MTFAPCNSTDFDAGCADDGTGYKVAFTAIPTSDGGTTITLRAVGSSGGLTGYTSFTLRRDTSGNPNPPTIGTLPNQAVQINATDQNWATYITRFVIGDLNDAGHEDISDINPGSFTNHSSDQNILPDSQITLQLVPPDEQYAPLEGPRSYVLTATTVPNTATGPVTVWIDLEDPQHNETVTTTSFVFQVVAASNAPPSISNSPVTETFKEQVPPDLNVVHAFTVSDNSPSAELGVSAFSSNTNLVPNDFDTNLVITRDQNGNGTVTITPANPLPSPSPGVPQASSITLSVVDNGYVRQTTFLYILAPEEGGVATSFSRPSGVYSLNAGLENRINDSFLTGEMHGKDVTWALLETGENVFDWTPIDDAIDNLPLLQDLSLNLQQEPCYIADDTHAQDREYDTWCDTNLGNQPDPEVCTSTSCTIGFTPGFKRAVPWDDYLRARRKHFLEMLTEHLNTTGRMAKISIINPNLPGAEAGIRNASLAFYSMDGYSRVRLLGAVQDELRSIQDNFPGKLVQIGFFKATDCDPNDPSCRDCTPECSNELWKWLYRDATTDPDAIDENGVHVVALFDEFNGIKRPRVSFFQENLAATRMPNPDVSPTPTPYPRSNAPNYITPNATTITPNGMPAYTFTPQLSFLPSFAYYPDPPSEEDLNARYNNGIVFQSLTPWSNPFMEDQGLRLLRTINGSPNDAMEAAFNAYLSQYLEVYLPDIDRATPVNPEEDPDLNAVLWEGELHSWHDYAQSRRDLAPIQPPAGLTVDRHTANGIVKNTVSWNGVFGAAYYTVQRMDFGTVSPAWVDAACGQTSQLECTDNHQFTPGAAYAYKVQASNGDGTITTDWAYVAVFLSEGDASIYGGDYDGYVSFDGGSTYTPVPGATPEPGIWAGRGVNNLTYRGFLSFNTAPDAFVGATVLGAKLRLYQTTGNADEALGPCKVDIIKGAFHFRTLEGQDYNWAASLDDAARVRPLSSAPDWVEAELLPDALQYINNTTGLMKRTQFRLHFDGTGLGLIKWNSGGTVGSDPSTPPQLIVRYTPAP